MISVIGPEETDEFNAACRLRGLIAAAWPDAVSEPGQDVRIIAAAKCYGQRTVDIDLVVLVHLAKSQPIEGLDPEQGRTVVQSLCLTIELKSHQPDSVSFEGNQLRVLMRNRWHNTSEQAHRQQSALRNYIEARQVRSPYVTSLIWLPYVPEEVLPKVCHNIVGTTGSWHTFLQRVAGLNQPKARWIPATEAHELRAFRDSDPATIVALLTARIEPSAVDRRKIEAINKYVLNTDTDWYRKLGQQQLIFRGRGGTGKTVRLIKLAHQLYIEHDARVLILTYNKALAADIRRLLALMNISSDFAHSAIDIQTIHAFLYQVSRHLGMLNPNQGFIANLEGQKARLLHYLQTIDDQGIVALRNDSPEQFAWDYILIDEAQDLPDDERAIFYKLFDTNRLVLADGVDQFVRGVPYRNGSKLDHPQRQVVTLRKSMRLKAGLCRFANVVAKHLDIDWELEPNDTIYGGRIVVLEGLYAANREFHDMLMRQAKEAGNAPLDQLFCVPPSLVNRKQPNRAYSYVGKRFQQWGYDVWDGTNEDTRGTFPEHIDQLRIVQYESCRGLEGWTVVNLGFDEFYDYKLRTYHPPQGKQLSLLIDPQQAAREHAARWLMMPLTRAIDTLVIQIQSADHYVGQVLRAAQRECGDIVEWHTGTSSEIPQVAMSAPSHRPPAVQP